ncbi:MAG TPA: hypothetical protein DDY78_15415 [Planctomycetales bacterium]|nr:hypothetical protein [Planctomycetales bacterium]
MGLLPRRRPGDASYPCDRDRLAAVRSLIRQAVEQEKWNRTRAAEVLGISRRQLFDKVRQYELQK